ncbi:MAG: protein jag [Clostridiaceae bacterium]|nr:protein jag [Clostridiaceae bacterium]
MERMVEKSGRTVQEAIEAALLELNVPQSKVDVEVLEEGTRGLFGFIGAKMAKVRITHREKGVDKGTEFLKNVLANMNVEAEISVEQSNDRLIFDISGDKIGIVIGRRGETLDALQYLTSLVVNRGEESYKRIVINVENYREKREETLVKLALRLADRVTRYKKDVTLESMNPYERRIIHATLQNHKFVRTYSVGEDPGRKVVISLKKV